MDALIDKLFLQSQANAIRKLWEDVDSRLLIQKEIGKKLLDHADIISDLPLTQLMFITSLSNFADSEQECYNIASIIHWGIHKIDLMPKVTEHKGQELAYRCLICLSLFKGYMIMRCEHYGYPSPSFYRNAGIGSFKQIGMADIGDHFNQWESFIGEVFV